uniref:D-inositol-3-phosphate glycosyltransferase n=1 Tax=Candidatus Methanophagaceae archaeon ANME-1 ERB6 TaxID=2759912 RepID=A0A7G9YWF3_9EURY|nr:D-inositol-3-phosphate glycosyltransferase [Methanosarcinales archaeon ANME-1 ERB6]
MKKNLNLLFLPKLLPRADIIGGPILIYHRIKNLSLMGHRITLIAPAYTEADRKDKSLEPFCEEVIRVDSVRERTREEVEALYKKLKRPRTFLTGDGAYDKAIEEALSRTLKERHFDSIIAEYSMMGQYIEANRSHIPADTVAIISVHECYTKAFELRAKKGEDISEDTIKELFNYEFKMYDTADKMLTLTGGDANILINYAPNLKKKIRVVPHGVDTAFYTPPKKKSWERNTKKILYLGNFQHYPNVDAVNNFIRYCWDRILQEVPDATFYAIGFNPPQELLDLRSDNVIVQEGGDNDNVRRFYRNSDVFVAPIELGTGFRGKLLEAKACGLPIVATRLATFGMNPVNGKDMFVADDYDVFSERVIMLLKDAGLRKKIGMNALARAKKFDHKHAAEKLERVLKVGKEEV